MSLTIGVLKSNKSSSLPVSDQPIIIRLSTDARLLPVYSGALTVEFLFTVFVSIVFPSILSTNVTLCVIVGSTHLA